MSAAALILAGLLSAADTPAKGPVTRGVPITQPGAAGPALRIPVPLLSQADAPDSRWLFEFWMGWFDR